MEQKECPGWLQLKLHGARLSRQMLHVGATPSFEQLVQMVTPLDDSALRQMDAEQVSHSDRA